MGGMNKPAKNRSGKRKPSLHQQQMRFFTVLFGVLAVIIAVAFILLLNATPWVSR